MSDCPGARSLQSQVSVKVLSVCGFHPGDWYLPARPPSAPAGQGAGQAHMEEKKTEVQAAPFSQDPKGKGQEQMVLNSISHFPSRAWAGLREGREAALKLG